MKLRILYEDNIKNGHKVYTEIEVPDGDYSVTLDLDYQQRLAETKPEKKHEVKRCSTLQEVYDIMNDREYNQWRKAHRYLGNYTGQENEEDGTEAGDEEGGGWCEPLMSEVADDRIFRKDELKREEDADYEDICQWVRSVCGKKQNWADAFIAVRMDGKSVNDYAAEIGVKDASVVSKWLGRVQKKLQEEYGSR